MWQQLLTPSGMNDLRLGVIDAFEWFLHSSPLSNFQSIQANGLVPKNPGFNALPAEVVKAIADDPASYVCLNPIGTTRISFGNTNNKLFRIAVSAKDLPQRLTLDWSLTEWESYFKAHRRQCPTADAVSSAVYAIRQVGSVASYDPIPPESLLVQCVGQSYDKPDTWTPIVDALIQNLEVI